MAKIKLTHVLPDGTVATRTTTRSYGFVVIGRNDYQARRERLQGGASYAGWRKLSEDNFKFFQSVIKAGVGGRYSTDHSYTATQHDYDNAVREVGTCTTADEYVERKRLEALARFEEKARGAEAGPWKVITWSSRMDLAQKEASKQGGKGYWRDLKAVAIIPKEG